MIGKTDKADEPRMSEEGQTFAFGRVSGRAGVPLIADARHFPAPYSEFRPVLCRFLGHLPVAMGGDWLDCVEDRLHGGDAAQMGTAGLTCHRTFIQPEPESFRLIRRLAQVELHQHTNRALMGG